MSSKEGEGSSTPSDTSSQATTSNPPQSTSPPPKPKARYARVYGVFGFTRGYNFPLWIIFAGAMLGFSLSRLHFLDYDGHFAKESAPGLMYYFSRGAPRIGMIIHLATALPAGILMVLQFTPIIRHKALLFHRINGYVVLLLLLISNASACILLPHNHGRSRMDAQTAEGFLVIITTVGMALAYWNVKRLQIDQHRAWMLRTMFYFGTIITDRILLNLASVIITKMGGYYQLWTCGELDYIYDYYGLGEMPADEYPQCLESGATPDTLVAVSAQRISTSLEGTSASTTLPLGPMLWLSIVMHLVGVEIYLALTPREGERLRRVSYEKQLEAGLKHPGSAGITSDRWGDAESYKPT